MTLQIQVQNFDLFHLGRYRGLPRPLCGLQLIIISAVSPSLATEDSEDKERTNVKQVVVGFSGAEQLHHVFECFQGDSQEQERRLDCHHLPSDFIMGIDA